MVTTAARDRMAAVPAPVLVLGGIVSVQVGGALAKSLFDQVSAAGVTTLRLAAAAVVMLVLVRRIRLHRDELALLGLYGLSLAVMNGTFYQALSRVPIGAAVTVEFLGPLAVAVAGSRRRRDALAVVLAASGILLLARGGGHLDPLGLLLAAVAGACWGAYIVISAEVGRRHSGSAPLAVAMTVGAVLVLPFGLPSALHADAHTLLIGAGVGVLSSVIPYSLELQALRRLPANVFGVLMSLEPAVAALAGLVVLGERLHAPQWVGIGCVIAACAAVTATRSPDR